MGQKEIDIIRDMKLPQDSKLIRVGKNVVGIKTTDGSFDYGGEGQKFLRPDAKTLSSKDNSTGIK